MIDGMTMDKIAVSLPHQVVSRARRAVQRGRASSMSAYVAAALTQKNQADELEELLAEMLAESGGPLTKLEQAAADAALFGSKRKTR